MKKNRLFIFIFFLTFSFFRASETAALDYTEISSSLADFFDSFYGKNEGTTGFRSLLIPPGGRSESLGASSTALSDDISCVDFNPAASSLLDETEIAFFHTSWIADSNIESLAFSTRFNNFGVGGKISCFYVPFTEYDSFGSRVAGSYYSETTGSANFSYNFLSGYNFKGIAAGLNLKFAWRSVPDYTDDNTGEIISSSGLEQSALAFMADFGIMLQFNLAKFYSAEEANFKVGLSASNFGAAITGFSSEKGIVQDDPLPSTVGIGISYKFLRPVTISVEFRQPLNLQDFSEYQMFYAGTGISVQIAKFFSVQGGFQLKGANPRFSLGGEAVISKIKLNASYTLDLTSSMNPLNRFSFSAGILLGNKGRAKKHEEVKRLYNEGIYFFSQKEYEKAIEKWQEALRIDKNFDPAKNGIKTARMYSEMLKNMENLSAS